MADRDDTKPDRPFGADTVEHPHVDLRTGERARPVPENPEGEAKPMPKREAPADEAASGGRHVSTFATPDRGQAHTADHSTAPPSGSSRAAVEAPRSGRSIKALIGAVVAVIVLILLFLLFPTEAEAMLPAVSS